MDYCYHLCTQQGLSPKLSYGIPFYYGQRWVCYTNNKPKAGMELCFTRGFEFEDPTGLLQAHGRKMIKGVTFKTLEEIDEPALLAILETAIRLDQNR